MYINPINYTDSRPIIMRIDYAGRTDQQPVYMGYAMTNTAETNTDWIIFKYTYTDDSGLLTEKNVSYGAWSNRISLTYD